MLLFRDLPSIRIFYAIAIHNDVLIKLNSDLQTQLSDRWPYDVNYVAAPALQTVLRQLLLCVWPGSKVRAVERGPVSLAGSRPLIGIVTSLEITA